jgi:hypothetical protein
LIALVAGVCPCLPPASAGDGCCDVKTGWRAAASGCCDEHASAVSRDPAVPASIAAHAPAPQSAALVASGKHVALSAPAFVPTAPAVLRI